jgi:AraC-like DNA-binding protein
MPATLPRLAFGEAQATPEGGVHGLLDAQRVTHRSLVSYAPLVRPEEFRHKSAVVTIGGLRLAASAHEPIRVVVDASDDVTLMVPFAGWSTAMIEGREYRWLAGRSAMYLPGVPRRGEAGLRSTLTIGMEAARLEQAARAVACDTDPVAIRSALATPRPVPLTQGGFSFATALRQICGLIDSCLGRPGQLALLGVDEMVYRGVAMLLLPTPALASDATVNRCPGRWPVDRACDYALAHLFSPIRLEALEAACGLKARALQMAFLKHHGRTPRQWILDRRLDAARARLAEPERTVLSVALECGFTRISSFSRAYQARFGELPSGTIARRS